MTVFQGLELVLKEGLELIKPLAEDEVDDVSGCTIPGNTNAKAWVAAVELLFKDIQ